MAAPIDTCCICLKTETMTREHFPPKTAFNESTLLSRTINRALSHSEVVWETNERTGGNWAYRLCGSCNSRTGGWYGAAYGAFCKAVAPHAHLGNVGKTVTVRVRNFWPLFVAKEALASFCSSAGPGFSAKHPAVREFVLNQYKSGRPGLLSLCAYLVGSPSGRTTGVAGIADVDRETLLPIRGQVVAELAMWPVGWLLFFVDQVPAGECNVTRWLSYRPGGKRDEELALPCRWIAAPYPMDYRSPSQVIADFDRSRRQ